MRTNRISTFLLAVIVLPVIMGCAEPPKPNFEKVRRDAKKSQKAVDEEAETQQEAEQEKSKGK